MSPPLPPRVLPSSHAPILAVGTWLALSRSEFQDRLKAESVERERRRFEFDRKRLVRAQVRPMLSDHSTPATSTHQWRLGLRLGVAKQNATAACCGYALLSGPVLHFQVDHQLALRVIREEKRKGRPVTIVVHDQQVG